MSVFQIFVTFLKMIIFCSFLTAACCSHKKIMKIKRRDLPEEFLKPLTKMCDEIQEEFQLQIWHLID